MTEIVSLSAVELRRRIGNNEITPIDLVEACIDRIATVNPQVNAVVSSDYIGARRAAERATEAVRAGAAGAGHARALGSGPIDFILSVLIAILSR